MDSHFRAFSFVDRITRLGPGDSIRGQYTIPPTLDAFPASLVAEAVGQLAAWAAMATVRCSHRPVAGIAGTIELLSAVHPGQVLDLAAELESVDTETVGYGGSAHADGIPVIRLLDCVGPMLPVEDFDDPQSVRDRLPFLRTVGAAPGGFDGLPALALDPCGGERDRVARARLHVPAAAPFFADHFPRRPVFPGTLLMHASLQAAALLATPATSANGGAWMPRTVSDVKLRTFISPGETLSLEARRIGHSDSSLAIAVESRIKQRLVGSAEILFCPALNL
jgi:3-hydroxymyristoyl/3-hydroxydecanoyl-(acyl carrier protein) dehydratase